MNILYALYSVFFRKVIGGKAIHKNKFYIDEFGNLIHFECFTGSGWMDFNGNYWNYSADTKCYVRSMLRIGEDKKFGRVLHELNYWDKKKHWPKILKYESDTKNTRNSF